jgi:addiction module HigA family antidote
MANKDRLPPIHPGEILREEFLSPLGMSAHQLAMALRVPATRINDIVNEKRGITADTALRRERLVCILYPVSDAVVDEQY